MDSIINKLTEIESAASAIVQHAEAEKSALDEKFDKKRMDFDKELEADTQRQIQGIRDKLESETSRILSGQSQESQDELDALQAVADHAVDGVAAAAAHADDLYRRYVFVHFFVEHECHIIVLHRILS